MGVTLRELIYDVGGGIPNGRQLKAVIPGGSSVPVLTADQIDVPLDADLDGRGGLDARLRRDHRHRRPLLHGAARPAGRAVLHARELRQVHAVPRGHALDGADPRVDRGRDRPPRSDLDLLLDVCDRILGKCLCPLGDAAAMPVASYIDKFRAEFREHLEVGCPMHGASSLENVLAPVDQHTHHPGRRGARVSATETETVTVTSTGARSQVAKGTGLVETAAAAGIEIPVFCYEPRLGPAVGACRMCLVEIEGIPEAPGRLHPDGAGRDDRAHGAVLREGGRGPERDARVHPRQPPARLPGLRQGRRVPAPGPDVQVRARARRG